MSSCVVFERRVGDARWVHLDRSVPEARGWLESEGLDDVAIDELLVEMTRPQVVAHDGGVLITLRGVNLNPGAEPADMVAIRIWAEDERIFTLRKFRIQTVDVVMQAIDRGEGPTSIGGLLVAISDGLVRRIATVVDDVSEQIGVLEDEVIDPSVRVKRDDLIELRRHVVSMHRYLVPQREAFEDMNGLELFDEDQREVLESVMHRSSRLIEDLAMLRERAAVVQEELSAQMAEELNGRMYFMTIIAAIFLPLSFVTGLLGMNVGGIPGSGPWGFGAVIGGLVLITFALWVTFRRFRWV